MESGLYTSMQAPLDSEMINTIFRAGSLD